MNGNDTLRNVLTFIIAFIVIVLFAIFLMIAVMWILKVAADFTEVGTDFVVAASILVAALIIGGATFAKRS